MSNRMHIAAMNHPLPLARENSIVEPSKPWGGYTLSTDFGDGYRVVWFGDDLDDLLRRLREVGPVTEHEDGHWYVYACEVCKDTRSVPAPDLGKGATGTCGDCS